MPYPDCHGRSRLAGQPGHGFIDRKIVSWFPVDLNYAVAGQHAPVESWGPLDRTDHHQHAINHTEFDADAAELAIHSLLELGVLLRGYVAAERVEAQKHPVYCPA